MARLSLLLCLLLPVVVRVVRGEGVISKVSMLPVLTMVNMASMVRGEGVLSMLNKREQHSQVSRIYHPHQHFYHPHPSQHFHQSPHSHHSYHSQHHHHPLPSLPVVVVWVSLLC